jgi:hypothetical protein
MRLQEAADSSETVVTNYKALFCGIPECHSLNFTVEATNVIFSRLCNDNSPKTEKSRSFGV